LTREESFINYFANLSIESLNDLESFFAQNAHFKDPFNDVIGVNAIRKIFTHMFATTINPKFVIIHNAQSDNILFINWRFEFLKNNKQWKLDGCSRVSFDSNNKVIEHIDYWDPAEQIYTKIGLLKPLMNFLVKRLKA